MGLKQLFALERSQKIDDFLLLLSAQFIEMLDHPVCFAAAALVSPDGVYQVVGPPVMEEEYTLPDSPKRGCPELVGACAALRDAVGKAFAHVVDKKIGEKICRLI